jgi:phage-related protein
LWDGAGGVVEWLSGIAGRTLAAVGDLSRTLWNAGVDLIQGLINGIRSKLSDLGGVLSGVTSFIRDHKGPEERDRRLLEPAGKLVMEGLARGMLTGLDEVGRATRLVTDRLTAGLSPVTVAGAGVGGAGAAFAGAGPAGGTTVIVQVQGPVYGLPNFQQAVAEAVREALRTRALSVR